MADAIHGMGDTAAELIAAIAYKEAARPPDKEHPWGHGKIETVGAVVVACLLLYIAISLGSDSLATIMPMLRRRFFPRMTLNNADCVHCNCAAAYPSAEDAGDLSAKGNVLGTVTGGGKQEEQKASVDAQEGRCVRYLAIIITSMSIVLKEALFMSTLDVGQREHSKLVMASAWHHRSDSLAAAVALASQVGSSFGHHFLDPLGGGIVASMLAHSAYTSLLNSWHDLTDYNAAAHSDVEGVWACCGGQELSRSISDIQGVRSHEIRTRRMGPYCLVDTTIVVDARISASAASLIAESVRMRVLEDFRPFVTDVSVHVDPEGSPQGQRPGEQLADDAQASDVGSGGAVDFLQVMGVEELESRVRDALLTLKDERPDLPRIAEVTEFQSYYYGTEDDDAIDKVDGAEVAGERPRPYVEIKADIRLQDESVSLRLAAAVARAGRRRVLAALPRIVREIDLDLELSEVGDASNSADAGADKGDASGTIAAVQNSETVSSKLHDGAESPQHDGSQPGSACATGAWAAERPGHGNWHNDICAPSAAAMKPGMAHFGPRERRDLRQVMLIWERGAESREARMPTIRHDQRATWTLSRTWPVASFPRGWRGGFQSGDVKRRGEPLMDRVN